MSNELKRPLLLKMGGEFLSTGAIRNVHREIRVRIVEGPDSLQTSGSNMRNGGSKTRHACIRRKRSRPQPRQCSAGLACSFLFPPSMNPKAKNGVPLALPDSRFPVSFVK